MAGGFEGSGFRGDTVFLGGSGGFRAYRIGLAFGVSILGAEKGLEAFTVVGL